MFFYVLVWKKKQLCCVGWSELSGSCDSNEAASAASRGERVREGPPWCCALVICLAEVWIWRHRQFVILNTSLDKVDCPTFINTNLCPQRKKINQYVQTIFTFCNNPHVTGYDVNQSTDNWLNGFCATILYEVLKDTKRSRGGGPFSALVWMAGVRIFLAGC